MNLEKGQIVETDEKGRKSKVVKIEDNTVTLEVTNRGNVGENEINMYPEVGYQYTKEI